MLLNDYDPNRRDVITIVPDGLGEGLPAEFGTLAMLADGQDLVVTPSAGARGSASFTYRITDGFALSEPATVTLTVVDTDTNTAPEWCPVEGCQRTWPKPELAPGGTLVMPILEGWVDPRVIR
ncbi:cadherin-like domain-containing protein [Leucobacter insecticola]|uniref:Cadherin-like domain-containing protein n=1 Tax=Leucobacter insecticola TaxID=2714934 RepID=A0A6G8FFX1_9MICO|nr:Ig-like domain-containing protein [Leucobacter insecticola]QIM15291.1 cadherin-like domain-containing protein [Leucobacter insecticola]